MQLSSVAVYGGGCWPDLQAHLSFPLPAVSGVSYYYKVVDIIDGTYTTIPGPPGALVIGDMITIQPAQELMVYNEQASGGLFLQVWASGTPTTAGQAHPCASSDLWMSNLLLCFEGLNCLLGADCTTELSNSVPAMPASNDLSFVPPTAGNGYHLLVNDGGNASVFDSQGRVVASQQGRVLRMDLSALPDGAYMLRLDREGRALSSRFLVSH